MISNSTLLKARFISVFSILRRSLNSLVITLLELPGGFSRSLFRNSSRWTWIIVQFWNSVVASWNIANVIHLYRAPNVLKQYQASWTLKLHPYLKLSHFYCERVRSIFKLMENEFSLWSETWRRDIIGRNGSFGCYGGLGMFFYNLVTVSLPIHMNNHHVLIKFI